MKQLVIKDAVVPFMRGTIDVGWRVKHLDSYRDCMWGNTKNDETLKSLVKDIIDKFGPVIVVDTRSALDITPERGEP